MPQKLYSQAPAVCKAIACTQIPVGDCCTVLAAARTVMSSQAVRTRRTSCLAVFVWQSTPCCTEAHSPRTQFLGEVGQSSNAGRTPKTETVERGRLSACPSEVEAPGWPSVQTQDVRSTCDQLPVASIGSSSSAQEAPHDMNRRVLSATNETRRDKCGRGIACCSCRVRARDLDDRYLT